MHNGSPAWLAVERSEWSHDRRRFLAGLGVGAALALRPWVAAAADDEPAAPLPPTGPAELTGPGGEPIRSVTLGAGDLSADLLDNARSPDVLSGVASLVNTADAPGFNAFDPDTPGAGAGLNFEHVIAGHAHPANAFTPRHGRYELFRGPGEHAATLVRRADDDPWKLASTLTYTVAAPHYLDVDFRCVPHDPALFGPRGYAILFFANYMNDVEDPALHFRGVEAAGAAETWVRADAPQGPPHWVGGGTYRGRDAADLEFDPGHNFNLNTWSYDYPRFTRPFYFGRAARGMVFQIMFDRAWSEADEVRFSLFKFKLPKLQRPAWDFQYVMRRIERGKRYGFRARVVWKKFVSPEDCAAEYDRWARGLEAPPANG